jgi:IS30 family transposase
MAGAVLSAHEREEIRVGIETKESLSDVARRLGRVPSTITREVKRNGGRSRYCAASAQGQSQRLRSRPRDTTFQANPELARHVEDRLRAKDSPTTIAIELARAGGISGVTVSPETIYQGVYAHGAKGLATGLGQHLHRKRSRRRRRCRAGETPKKASPLGAFNLIHLRPEVAHERTEVGHFEGDLIIGAGGKSAIVTLIDRASRLNLIGDLPGGHGAENVLACCVELFERVPVELRRTLAWDQGSEMARHLDLADAVGIDVFFAEPHSPWMRPTNENFNGLLRRYVGKGTDLSIYSQDDLDVISHRINTMPRRIFQWASAEDRYNAAVVALTA